MLLVKGKTGERRIRLIRSAPYLTKWLENHPQRNVKDAPLWCTMSAFKGEYKRPAKCSVQFFLGELAEKTGVSKPVHPHANTVKHSSLSIFFGASRSEIW